MAVDRIQLAKMIDLTLLKAYATREDVVRLCEEGRRYGFAAVCVNPAFVFLASRLLKGSGVKAAGGIRTYEFALKLIEAGSSRLGTSSGVKIVEECPL